MVTKGIILGGGVGTRLYPMTLAVNKHLLTVYDKPMVYYPIATLLTLGICEIALVTHPQDFEQYQRLLGNGERFGINLMYIVEKERQSPAKNILLCANFIGQDSFCLMMGDNFFYSNYLEHALDSVLDQITGVVIFTYLVDNPDQFGVLISDDNHKPIRIEEKPQIKRSAQAVTGLYFYNSDVLTIVKNNQSFQITEINNYFLQENHLMAVELSGQWYDLGTVDSLVLACEYIRRCQSQKGILIGSPELIAWKKKHITDEEFNHSIKLFHNCSYGKKLLEIYQGQ